MHANAWSDGYLESFSRREMLRRAGIVGAAIALGCNSESDRGSNGRLSVRPFPPSSSLTPGTHDITLPSGSGGIIYVPDGYEATTAAPLVLLLHGAGGSGAGISDGFIAIANDYDMVLCAPDARGVTWDATRNEFGPDVRFIDAALERVFAGVNIDPARIGIAGFSDGATYALSLGLINGDLFSDIIAFSPGFIVTGERHGSPQIFISHGVSDPILPIQQCSRVIVPFLEELGYDVQYEEFSGGHVIPSTVAMVAFARLLGTPEIQRARSG